MPAEDQQETPSAHLGALRRLPPDLLRAAYGPGATEADRTALDAALRESLGEESQAPSAADDAARADPSDTPDAATTGLRRRGFPRRVGAAALVLSVVVAAVFVWLTATAARRSDTDGVPKVIEPAIVATPIALLGDVENSRRQQYALTHLFDNAKATDLREFLLTYHFGETVVPAAGATPINGLATGPQSFDLGHLYDGASSRTISVLLTCDRSSAFSWTLSSPGPQHDDPAGIRVGGSECSDRVFRTTVRARDGRLPTRLEVVIPADVRMLVTVVLSRTP